MASRWKSGQRRNQVTFVVARRRLGRPGRRSAGSSLLAGEVQASGPQHKANPAASKDTTPTGANWEPSPGSTDDGHGRGEELGDAASSLIDKFRSHRASLPAYVPLCRT